MTTMYALAVILMGCADTSIWAVGDDPAIRETGIDFGQDTAEGESGDTGDDEGPWRGQWAELHVTSGEVGGVVGFLDWDGVAVTCEVELEVVSAEVATGCPSCAVAATLVFGSANVVSDVDGACARLGWTALEGSSSTVGHVAPEALWSSDGTWREVGWSSLTASSWAFERPL